MNIFLESMVALMMVYANNPQYLVATAPGQYYEPVKVEYNSQENRSYAIWVRYYVWGEKYGVYSSYNRTSQHLQVISYPGVVSVEGLKKDGRDRTDAGIEVVSALK